MFGRLANRPQIATPAGLRQNFYANRITKQVWEWNRKALRGYIYLITDKGPLKQWLHTIGRAEDNRCDCGEPQNAAHLLRCGLLGDKERTLKSIEEAPEWCEKVAGILPEELEDRGGSGARECI